MRWQVELNLRYIKSQLHCQQLECHSAQMARKQWLATLIAYNLIRGFMLAAAIENKINPLELSFVAARNFLQQWLRDCSCSHNAHPLSFDQILRLLASCSRPKRKKSRPDEPRLKYHIRENFGPLKETRTQARQKLKKENLKC